MSSNDTALRHNALVYADDDEYLARAVPFVREGLSAGDGVIVAHTKPGLAMMREALGADAGAVTFVDVGSAYTRPAQTLAAYHKVFVELLRQAPSLRAISDVQVGSDAGEWDLWTVYEAVATRSFAHLPVWVLCTYDAEGLPDPVLEAVWQTHAEVLADGTWRTSGDYEDPDHLLRRLTPAPEPLPELRSIPFGPDVEAFRELLARELLAERVPETQVLAMLLAATEIAANALEHGGGVEDVRVGRAQGRFVCEVIDRGEGFDDPAAGYLAPRPGSGAGLWVARQLTWRLELFQAAAGFTSRIWL
jgi:anti-sigma regulatory factor (Ser/Thr protein kinase)